jgi:hypothetical protein
MNLSLIQLTSEFARLSDDMGYLKTATEGITSKLDQVDSNIQKTWDIINTRLEEASNNLYNNILYLTAGSTGLLATLILISMLRKR